jgi:hypothetical protein
MRTFKFRRLDIPHEAILGAAHLLHLLHLLHFSTNDKQQAIP